MNKNLSALCSYLHTSRMITRIIVASTAARTQVIAAAIEVATSFTSLFKAVSGVEVLPNTVGVSR